MKKNNDSVIYNGKMIPKNQFRAYVYSVDGSKKLSNSWDEYKLLLDSGTWFETKEGALASVSSSEIKKKGKA